MAAGDQRRQKDGEHAPLAAFVWPAIVSLLVGVVVTFALTIIGGAVLASVGLMLSAIAGWARIKPSESIPRLVALLLATLLVVYLVFTQTHGQ